jgi:cysteinyl-tRNA synthetase
MHRLFAERLQCKMNRDFPRAESIRAELFSAGVRIHDGNREWRADGQGYGKVDPNLPYEMSPDAGPSVSVLAEPEIHRLISETLQCMLTHDFIRVNSIRAELFSAGVRLDDYRRLWRADGQGFVRANRPYEMSPGAGPSLSVLPDPEIYRLIAERLQCRLSRDFQRADSILAELTSAGVRLDDGRREWRADGQGIRKADPNRPGGRIANADRYTSYRMAPEAGPNLSVLPEPEIHRLVAERLQCRLIRDFVMADSIRAELFSAGVTLDDGRRQWRADASGSNRHEYKISQDAGPSVAVLPEPEIHRLIAARWQCKISRDFPGANSIQEELYSAGVMLDDYRKEWRADGQGFGNADPNLA